MKIDFCSKNIVYRREHELRGLFQKNMIYKSDINMGEQLLVLWWNNEDAALDMTQYGNFVKNVKDNVIYVRMSFVCLDISLNVFHIFMKFSDHNGNLD